VRHFRDPGKADLGLLPKLEDVQYWEAEIETKGLSDLHVVEVTIQPGGTLGWHSHLGPSFVIVKSGRANFYEADDPTCKRSASERC
jgi:quercetin dioxygenase-like cupin family protein